MPETTLEYVTRIRELREIHQIGLLEARRMADAESLHKDIDKAMTFNDLRDVIRRLAEKVL